ncbi:unnamed protein product [Trichobilharzia regenti]|nr:unnamed protein product [Trichobilharzia regenti]
MSRCRRFSNSGSRLSPKFSSTSGFSMNSSNKLQLSSVRTSGLKRPILSRTVGEFLFAFLSCPYNSYYLYFNRLVY